MVRRNEILVACALDGRRVDSVADVVRLRQVLGQVCQVLRQLDRVQQAKVDQVLLHTTWGFIRWQILQETHSFLDRAHLQDLVASGADR